MHSVSKTDTVSAGYVIDIFMKGFPGFFRYDVGTKEQAMTHFGAITIHGYRRLDDRGNFVWYSPDMIQMIKINGPGLETQYPDKFIRT